MRSLITILAAGLLATLPVAAESFDHSGFDSVLSTYVNALGQVDYASLKANRSGLDAYVAALGETSPKSHPKRFPTREDKLAYWINAYNALVLRGVIDAYPVKSVKDIKYFMGFFNRTWSTVGGESYTLNNIEHDVLRAEFKEPRIHAAINCASVGCPRLEPTAFFADGIDDQLEAVMRKFLNESRNVTIEASRKRVTLSKILDWFGSDFTNWYESKLNVDDARILDYVSLYVEGERAAGFDRTWEVRFHDYDWSLNDQVGPQEMP